MEVDGGSPGSMVSLLKLMKVDERSPGRAES